ncbi:MAG: DUF1223 domain-containing protein [Xanthobacteraceae bacterium]
MVRRSLAYAVLAFCTSGTVSWEAGAEPRATIELFTSQGCSSCPAADKLLAELAADPTLVPISVPIDYWDYLGWKDTLANPHNTARQRAYAQVRGDEKVYTPQVVVNGAVHVLGSDKAAIEHAISKSRGKNGAMTVAPVELTVADEQISVAVPDAPAAVARQGSDAAEANAEVWLFGLAKGIKIAIARGENKGQEITYHNVLRRWIKLGEWSGKAASWSIARHKLEVDGVDTAVVVLQRGSEQKPRAVLGAALVALK